MNLSQPGSISFFIPSYLENSRYAQKLSTAFQARLRALREHSPNTPINHITIWSPFSNAKLAPSHRGMTYDVIESNPPIAEDVMPLPFKWNNQDKYPGLDILGEGYSVKYNGAPGKDLEAASLRTDFPIPPATGIYYFEITITKKDKDCAVAIGFSTQKCSLERLPGWEPESWAYHSDDGKSFWGDSQGRPYGPHFGVGDVIGCGLDFNKKQAFYTRNGQELGPAFKEVPLPDHRVFPCVGIKKYPGALLDANFGQAPFSFDIRRKTAEIGRSVEDDIMRTKTSSLHPALSETHFTQELIAQFLSHGGYIETAKAFAAQVQKNRKILTGSASIPSTLQHSTSPDAEPRQLIRQAILRGDVITALNKTIEYFPSIQTQSPIVVFQLRCRHFLELLICAGDLATSNSNNGLANGQSLEGSAMDIDDELNPTNGNGKAPEDESATRMTTEAIDYGRKLRAEYYNEDEMYKKELDEMFSLLAYPIPVQSPNGGLLKLEGRTKVAEDLNSAILKTLGRSPTAALETVLKQTEALIDRLSADGGPAAFVNLQNENLSYWRRLIGFHPSDAPILPPGLDIPEEARRWLPL